MVYEHLQTTEKSPQKEMSSNIRIEKICEWCGKQFTAQTTVTRFCSKRCSEHAYKERLRQQKIQMAKAIPTSKNSELKEKDYLTVAEAGQILGITMPTKTRVFSRLFYWLGIVEQRLNRQVGPPFEDEYKKTDLLWIIFSFKVSIR